MKISDALVRFAADTGRSDVTLYTKFQDYFCHYMSEHDKKNIGSFDKSVDLQAKEQEMYKDFLAEVERMSNTKLTGDVNDMAVQANNPMVKYAAFAVVNAMIEAILPMTIIDSIGVYTDIRNVDFGDSMNFEIKPRSLFTVSQGANAQRTAFIQKQFSANKTIVPVNHAVTVQVALYKVLSGKESLAEFARKAVLSIETEMTKDAYGAFTTGLNAVTMPAALSVTGYTQQDLLSICQRVTAYNQGANATIVGTAVALSNILPNGADGYRIVTNSDNISIQLIRNFFGYDIIVLPQVATGNYSTFDMALNDDEIYVLSPSSDKLVKGVIEGTMLTNSNDFYDNANLTQNATFNKRWQFEFVSNAVAGIVHLQ